MTALQHIVILMSDTGGGHRAAAEAIVEAIAREYPNRYRVTLFDGFKQAAIFPFNHVPSWYLPFTTYAEPLWHFLFLVSNNRFVTMLAQPFFDLVMGQGLRQFLRRSLPDLVVTVHPILNEFARRALRAIGSNAPFITVVTDLFDAHALWFDRGVDLCTVPTEGAYQMGLRAGMPSDKLRVVGEPVSLKFMDNVLTQAQARKKLNLAPDCKTVLLVGGGEGMGKLYEIACAIDRARVPAQLVVIAGRNQVLRRKLETTRWQMPVHIQGFVTNMPAWMRAADVIITKAGPGTISEALACGLPILLSGYLPGQETGNVTFVEQNGVGVLCQNPDDIARTLKDWLTPGNPTLARFATRARELAHPNAAIEIAKLLNGFLTTR